MLWRAPPSVSITQASIKIMPPVGGPAVTQMGDFARARDG